MADGSQFRVALTGGMASGKSTVSRLMRAAGLTVLDADAVVAELYQPGRAGAEAVRALLGEDVMTTDGAVDHPAVAQRIFEDPALRLAIEQAIHPLVGQRFAQRMKEVSGVVVAEVPLLFEAGWQSGFDFVVTVEADPETQIRRAVERGLDEAQARARLAAQTDNAIRRGGADFIIENDGSVADLAAQVAELIDRLRSHPAT